MSTVKEKILIKFSKIVTVIQNLVYWIPIIIKDMDSDNVSLYEMIYRKLKKMYDFYISNGYDDSWYQALTEMINAPFISPQMNEERLEALRQAVEISGRLCRGDYSEYNAQGYLDFERQQEEERDMLFKIIRENIEYWWD